MAELLDDLDWQGKVYSTGWTTSRGGVLESTEPATGEVLASVGLADADDISAAQWPRSRPNPNGPPSRGRSEPR
jgi:benzaldehyde dehydrogenase (NAD)